MDNLAKKQKNRIALALVAKLMGLAIVLNIASCSCKDDDKEKLKLSITGSDIKGKDREMKFVIKNDGQKEMDPEKAELKFHAEIVMKPKSGKSASNGNFQIGSHKGNVSSAIDKPFKDIVAGKISPGKDIKVSVKLTVDESIDEGATVTVTIEDKNGKKVADKSIKLSSIAS